MANGDDFFPRSDLEVGDVSYTQPTYASMSDEAFIGALTATMDMVREQDSPAVAAILEEAINRTRMLSAMRALGGMSDSDAHYAALLREHGLIKAVKEYRSAKAAGLAQAKRYIDNLAIRYAITPRLR